MNKYSYTKKLEISFSKAVEKTINALKTQGFGILTDIDVKSTFKEKLGIDFKQYRILGACNPPRALKSLEAEEEIGLLLPCNVIVYENENGVKVSVIKPTKAFSIVNNVKILAIAEEVEEMLIKTLKNI